MVTNKIAIICASVLRDYCNEKFSIENRKACPSCIFSRKKTPPHAIHSSVCYLEAFITGRYGEEHQKEITEEVENRLKELENGDKVGNLR